MQYANVDEMYEDRIMYASGIQHPEDFWLESIFEEENEDEIEEIE